MRTSLALDVPQICARCLRIHRDRPSGNALRLTVRPLSTSPPGRATSSNQRRDDDGNTIAVEREGSGTVEATTKDQGAMSRRLEDMSNASIEQGGRSAQKVVEQAGFDDALKQRLLDRIADAQFKSENLQAFAVAGMSTSAGKGSRDIASAEPWAGDERTEDSVLRMLDDSHKRLRVPSKIPGTTRPPKRVDTGRPKEKPSAGTRLASARERTTVYSHLKDSASEKDKERDERRKMFKDRFTQGARPMPNTIQGLTSLANERIEDAIARGQFKNLPRGKKIERDYNASNPFLDTTEYFMNKIIQKQDIVPPWIERQQELAETVSKFRSRMRKEWRRHAAMVIASQGGDLESQVRKAQQYMEAEALVNPPKGRNVGSPDVLGAGGHLSDISISGQLRVDRDPQDKDRTVNPEPVAAIVEVAPSHELPSVSEDTATTDLAQGKPSNPRISGGVVFPFRDPKWEEAERSYHTLAIEDINSKTRSYNLMAPAIAKKPYFSLERELRACYADAAPDLPTEIRERAKILPSRNGSIGHRTGSVMERFSADSKVSVYDSRRPHYGFKEFWRDLFGESAAQSRQ